MKKLLAFIIASLIVGAIMLAVGYVSVTAAATPSLGQYQLEESYLNLQRLYQKKVERANKLAEVPGVVP